MIIDHIEFNVAEFQNSKKFYLACLAPLGIELVVAVDGWAGFGKEGKPEFWFCAESSPQKPMHIAFIAENRAQVDQFYAAAIAAGGVDNGAPGIRETYHPNYYGAFVFDPDGHNIEAVCHQPEL